MAGYDYHRGMSNNAVDEYCRGNFPKSKISVSALQKAGWTLSKKIALSLIESGFWKHCSWHHTSSFYGKTNFYNCDDLIIKWNNLNKKEQNGEIKLATKDKSGKEQLIPVEGEYTVFGGTRRRPTVIGVQKFTGKKLGNWIYLPDGTKKSANGKWLEYTVI